MLGVRSSPSVQGEPVSATGGGGGLLGRGGSQAGRGGGQAGRGGTQAGRGGRQMSGVGRGRGLQIGRGASGPEERLSAEEILRPGDRRHEAAGVGQGQVHQVGRGETRQLL